MRRLLILMIVSVTTIAGFAQRTVTGKVVEEDTKDAVIQATASLLSGEKVVSNAVTNAEGNFSVKAPSDGTFTLRVTYVGFKTYTKKITVADGKSVSAGTISLAPDAIMLQGATVTAHLAKVQSKGDTLIFNADAYRVPEGSVVEELVKRMPGAEIDDNGNITINGKQVSKIKVDGRDFGDSKTALKNLPTSIIEKVRAYDEKSDLARITGIDDGNEQTVLDFGLRAGMNRGMMANTDLGYGTKDRYSGRLFGMYMRDDWRVMAMLNANNTNDQGMGMGGGRRFGGGGGMGGGGLNAAKTGMVNVNYEKPNKLIGQASVNFNHRDGDSWSRRSSENFNGGESSFQNSVNQSYSRNNNWSVQGRLEWTPDTLWNIAFRPNWSFGDNDGIGWNSSTTFNADPYDIVSYQLDAAILQQIIKTGGLTEYGDDLSRILVNGGINNSLSYGENKRLGGTLQVNRLLNGRGRNITIQLTGNYSKNENNQLSSNSTNLYQPGAITKYNGVDSLKAYQANRYNLSPTTSYDYSARATYSEPIAYATFLQFSYTFQYRYNESDRQTFDYSRPLLNNPTLDPYFGYDFNQIKPEYGNWNAYWNMVGSGYSPIKDDSYYSKDQSRYSAYKNYIHTGEIMLRFIRDTYDFNVGVQVIPQTSEYTQRYLGVDTVVNRTVTNWSPTANFRWRPSQQGSLQFQYRGSTSQPSIDQLLVINDDTDPMNKTTGNPDLKPSFTQNFNLRYNDYFMKYQRMIFANLTFSTTMNSIANKTSYDSKTGARTSRPENINGNWNLGGNITFNSAIDSLGYFSYNVTLNDQYNHRVGYVTDYTTRESVRNVTNSNNIGGRLGGSYRNDWLEVEINGSVNYNKTRNELQPNSNLDTWTFSYGMNSTVYLPWGSQLTTDISMNSRRGYTDESMNTNELIWNGQISHSFLRGKPLTLSVQFYDILGQQSNFSRTISAMARTDNEYNAITSYIMFRASYRLNLFGTRASRRGMMGGMGGMMPMGGGGRGGARGGGFGGGMPMGGGGMGGGFGGPGRF